MGHGAPSSNRVRAAKQADVEDVLESLAALCILAAYETGKTHRRKPARGAG